MRDSHEGLCDLVSRLTVASHGVAVYPAGATFGPRRMKEYEFVWIMEGSAEYRWGNHQVAAPPGSIILCRPGATDYFRWDPHGRTRHAYFHFNPGPLPAAWPDTQAWPLALYPPEGDILRPLFRYFLTWARSDTLARLTAAHMLTAYVTGAVACEEPPRDSWPDPVEKAWRYLHERLEEDPAAPLDLGELSGAACVTPEHLCRLFRLHTGRTPSETVRLARLDRAAMLLSHTNYPIGEIASLCGFASPFHFSRRFREAYGQPPRLLRQALRSGSTPRTPLLMRRR